MDRRKSAAYRKNKRRRKAKSKKFRFRLPDIRSKLEYLPEVIEWTFKIAVIGLLAFVSVWYFGQRVSTVGDSMKPVLENGDVVLVNRIV